MFSIRQVTHNALKLFTKRFTILMLFNPFDNLFLLYFNFCIHYILIALHNLLGSNLFIYF